LSVTPALHELECLYWGFCQSNYEHINHVNRMKKVAADIYSLNNACLRIKTTSNAGAWKITKSQVDWSKLRRDVFFANTCKIINAVKRACSTPICVDSVAPTMNACVCTQKTEFSEEEVICVDITGKRETTAEVCMFAKVNGGHELVSTGVDCKQHKEMVDNMANTQFNQRLRVLDTIAAEIQRKKATADAFRSSIADDKELLVSFHRAIAKGLMIDMQPYEKVSDAMEQKLDYLRPLEREIDFIESKFAELEVNASWEEERAQEIVDANNKWWVPLGEDANKNAKKARNKTTEKYLSALSSDMGIPISQLIEMRKIIFNAVVKDAVVVHPTYRCTVQIMHSVEEHATVCTQKPEVSKVVDNWTLEQLKKHYNNNYWSCMAALNSKTLPGRECVMAATEWTVEQNTPQRDYLGEKESAVGAEIKSDLDLFSDNFMHKKKAPQPVVGKKTTTQTTPAERKLSGKARAPRKARSEQPAERKTPRNRSVAQQVWLNQTLKCAKCGVMVTNRNKARHAKSPLCASAAALLAGAHLRQ